MYKIITVKEAVRVSGKKRVGTKFVDTNKGVATALNVLCEVNINFSKTKVDTNIDIEKKIETALYLLDSINDVKKYVKDNLKIFCKLKLIEGKQGQGSNDNGRLTRTEMEQQW